MPDNELSPYLQEVEDGLPMRSGEAYALQKLKVVELYLDIAMKAVKESPWRSSFYIDLQSGPGKNNLNGAIALGSPLIALTREQPFEHYRFNEANPELANALELRVNASPLKERVKISQMDVNQAVDSICEEIRQIDRKRIEGAFSSFNIAFLDPEGLELTWKTVAKLGSMSKMDLIINFSTGGLNRTRKNTPELGDAYFGTDEWRDIVGNEANATTKRRAWIDLYVRRLSELGYTFQADDEGQAEIVAKNSKNVQVYSIIFASKNKLGLKLWREAVKRARHPRLFD